MAELERIGGARDLVATWRAYRGSLLTRSVLVVAAACGYAAAWWLWPDDRSTLIAQGIVAIGAGLVHPMFLFAALVVTAGSFDLVSFDVRSDARATLGWPLILVGVAGIAWKTRRGLIRVSAIVILWTGMLLVSPAVFVLLAVLPMAMIFVNRRQKIRTQPVSIVSGSAPPDWREGITGVERAGGLRYLTTLHFGYEGSPDALAAVYALADGRGWAIALDSWLVMHSFGPKVLFTTPQRWTVTVPNELGQLSPGADLSDVVNEQRRVLARLAKWGMRPDRLPDTDAVAVIVHQFSEDARLRGRAGLWTVVRAMVDEELNLRRDGVGLMGSKSGLECLRQWADAR